MGLFNDNWFTDTYSRGGPVATPVSTGSVFDESYWNASSASPGSWWNGLQQKGRDTGFLTTKDKNGMETQGWGGMALGGLQGLGNLYLGLQQYGLAKDSLAFQKDKYAQDYAAQKGLTNAQLSDRQARRVIENPNATSVADYMAKYGIK